MKNKQITIEKPKELKILKRGDRIKLNGELYEVQNFSSNIVQEKNAKKESNEIILTKEGENSQVLLKQKYSVQQNNNLQGFKLLREMHKKTKFPQGFQEEKKIYFSSYKEAEF